MLDQPPERRLDQLFFVPDILEYLFSEYEIAAVDYDARIGYVVDVLYEAAFPEGDYVEGLCRLHAQTACRLTALLKEIYHVRQIQVCQSVGIVGEKRLVPVRGISRRP